MGKAFYSSPSLSQPCPVMSNLEREQLLTIYCNTSNYLKCIKYLSMYTYCLEHLYMNVIILHVLLCNLFSHFTINHGQHFHVSNRSTNFLKH